VSALDAAGPLAIGDVTTVSVAFSWLLPAGHYDGFHIYGSASEDGRVDCNDTVYGKNSC